MGHTMLTNTNINFISFRRIHEHACVRGAKDTGSLSSVFILPLFGMVFLDCLKRASIIYIISNSSIK